MTGSVTSCAFAVIPHPNFVSSLADRRLRLTPKMNTLIWGLGAISSITDGRIATWPMKT